MLDRLTENLGALRLAHDRLTLPTEAMNDGFAIWDAKDRLVLCNRRFRHFFNDLDADSTDLTFFQALDQHTRPLLALDDRVLSPYGASRASPVGSNGGTCRFDLKDGRHIEVSESRMQDGGTVGIYTDITETVRREAALNRSEARLANDHGIGRRGDRHL